MEIITPSYYSRFRCLAGACPDSCCKDWGVLADAESAARYRSLPGPLGDRLRRMLIETEDGVLLFDEHQKCPLWREDGLCTLQAELGHQALCQVCRDFPRLHHDYGSFQELGLELSCPEAARLILCDPGTPLLSRQEPGGEAPDYDPEIMAILRSTRPKALALLTAPACSVPEALARLLMYGYQVQNQLDGGPDTGFDAASALEEAKSFAVPGDPGDILAFLRELEILTEEWRARLSSPAEPGPWTAELLALARYGVLRYWLQAVSDFDLVCRVKWILVTVLTVRALGGDLLRTAQLYSKEIENDIDNMDAMLDAAYTHPAFTDAHLLGCLLKSRE